MKIFWYLWCLATYMSQVFGGCFSANSKESVACLVMMDYPDGMKYVTGYNIGKFEVDGNTKGVVRITSEFGTAWNGKGMSFPEMAKANMAALVIRIGFPKQLAQVISGSVEECNNYLANLVRGTIKWDMTNTGGEFLVSKPKIEVVKEKGGRKERIHAVIAKIGFQFGNFKVGLQNTSVSGGSKPEWKKKTANYTELPPAKNQSGNYRQLIMIETKTAKIQQFETLFYSDVARREIRTGMKLFLKGSSCTAIKVEFVDFVEFNDTSIKLYCIKSFTDALFE